MIKKNNSPMMSNSAKEAKTLTKYKRNKTIGLFGFFAITASMVMTVYEYPAFATSGWSSLLFLMLGGMCWFIPTAICAAEMATIKQWENGGIYTWVTNMMGPRWGFAAVFFQWFQITIGFVTMLYFVTSALSYGFGGDTGYNLVNTTNLHDGSENLSYSSIALFGIVVLVLLAITGSQMFGIKYTSIIAQVGFTLGILLTSGIMFVYGIIYIVNNGVGNLGNGLFPPESDLSTISQLVIFVSFILGYMGIEASASQARRLNKPSRNYPIAIMALVIVKIVFSGLGGLMIAVAIPPGEINLSGGIIQALLILTNDNVILVRIMTLMLALGVIAQISSWVVGPSDGLLFAAKKGALPTALARTNKHDIPYWIILIQTLCVIFWAAVITFGMGAGGGSAFLSAMTLTVLVYLLGYFLMYISYIIFVKKSDSLDRSFKIKHKWFQYLLAGLAIGSSMLAMIVSFFPQSSSATFDYGMYLAVLIPCFIISAVLPFIFYEIYKRLKKGSSSTDNKTNNKIDNSKKVAQIMIKQKSNTNLQKQLNKK